MVEGPFPNGELRQRSAQLNDLLHDWDPIGVMGAGTPHDEYNCLVGPLLTLLQSHATQAEIASHLHKEIDSHFGLSPEHYDFVAVAGRIKRWYDRDWRPLGAPVTIFVAMLGEGVDVWRPVQARALGDDLY